MVRSSAAPQSRRLTADAVHLLPISTRPVDPDMEESVYTVQKLLGYTFRDPTLLEDALTHSSYPQRRSVKRLEFVGDAALSLAFCNFLFHTNPDLHSGVLTILRAANVSTEKFARVAVRLGLYNHLRRNTPVLDKMVEQFTREVIKEPEEATDKASYGGSTLEAPKVLADITESVAGAIYIDCGLDLQILWKHFVKHLQPIVTAETMDVQPVTMLNELCQKHGLNYEYEFEVSKDNITVTRVLVKGEVVGIGSSEKKAISKLNATRDALDKLKSSLPDSPVRLPRDKEGAKKRLNELCQKNHWPKPHYRTTKEVGPAHDKRFVCSVEVTADSNVFVVEGEENTKVIDAEDSAAAKMLSEIMSATETEVPLNSLESHRCRFFLKWMLYLVLVLCIIQFFASSEYGSNEVKKTRNP